MSSWPCEFCRGPCNRRVSTTPAPSTIPAIPRPPRVPTATNWRHVEEVRYDLTHATAVALTSALGRVTTPFHYPDAEAVYGGLEAGESDALCLARVELCEWADRLGRR